MSFYLASILRAFLPQALLLALLLPGGALPWKRLSWAVGIGMAGSYLLTRWATAAHAAAHLAIAMPLAAMAAGLLLVPKRLKAMLPATIVLAAQATSDVIARTTDHAMTQATILNSDMIMNMAAVLFTAALIFAAFLVARHAAARAPLIGRCLAGVVLALLLAVWISVAGLGLLQLGSIEATAGRITLVARLTELLPYAIYAHLALLALLGLAAGRLPKAAGSDDAKAPERRKRDARRLTEARWRAGLAAIAVFSLASLLYQDAWASRPPSLSPAQDVVPDAKGEIHFPMDAVRDGLLHRYAYIAGDGHRVRFFLINRYDPAHPQIGVVFDACKLCGDQGYVQRGGEIICVACNVRIFVPSIGKPGGCNPVPLPHRATADEIVVTAAALEKGASLFSELVEIKVKDPVSGASLVNLTAPFKFDIDGRVFYFETEATYQAFKDDPARYLQGAK